MLDQSPLVVKSPHPYTIRLNPTARQYEFWNGRLQSAVPFESHPAYWLAHRTATKHPHLAAIAWRGAEVVARGRVVLNYLRLNRVFARQQVNRISGPLHTSLCP